MKSRVKQVSEILQTCSYYDAENGGELRAKVNTFSMLYETSVNTAKTHKTITECFAPNLQKEHKVPRTIFFIFQ